MRRKTDYGYRRYPLRGYGPAIAVVLVIVLGAFGFLFTRLERDHAIEVAKREVTAEGDRADLAICRIAETNREALIGLLLNARALVETAPNIEPADRMQALAFYDDALADARHPFPPPCDTIALS